MKRGLWFFLLPISYAIFAASLIFFVVTVCNGQDAYECKDGICRIVRKSNQDKYEWRYSNDEQILLYKAEKVVGQWYVPHLAYYPWDGEKVGQECKPPIDPPGREARVFPSGHWSVAGINADKLNHTDTPSLTYSGRSIHHSRLAEAFEGGGLDDDVGKGYFVVIAKDKADRDAVFADWQKLPDDFTSRYNVWIAPPDHFSMQDRFNGKPRFYTEGDPTIVLQNKDGVVLFRRPQSNQHYKSSDIQDLLKSDPNYNPRLDPGAPTSGSPFHINGQISAALVVAGSSIGVFMLRRKK